MKKSLTELIAPYESLSIVGMAKNAGKTTALNRIIREFNETGGILGLTSIGRDGETVDVVTSTDKPEIYVAKGTIIATSADMLPRCDITKEILETTGLSTPLGEVVFIRALSDGYVQLSGASINSQIAWVCGRFKRLGATKTIVDGAISRRTVSSPAITDATILSTGASYHVDMDVVVAETAHIVNMLMLPPVPDTDLAGVVSALPSGRRHCAFTREYEAVPFSLNEPPANIPGLAAVYMRGAVSDNVLSKLIMANMNLKGAAIIIDDASKLFIKEGTYDKLVRKGASIFVLHKINLVALTINPISVTGNHFDKHVFYEKISAKVAVPVYNVALEV